MKAALVVYAIVLAVLYLIGAWTNLDWGYLRDILTIDASHRFVVTLIFLALSFGLIGFIWECNRK